MDTCFTHIDSFESLMHLIHAYMMNKTDLLRDKNPLDPFGEHLPTIGRKVTAFALSGRRLILQYRELWQSLSHYCYSD